MAKRDIFNAKTQQEEKAELTVDDNNEIVAEFKDGGIVKFPAGVSKEELDDLIEQHKEANEGQEVITPEVEAKQKADRAASLAAIGDTTPESDTTHDEDDSSA